MPLVICNCKDNSSNKNLFQLVSETNSNIIKYHSTGDEEYLINSYNKIKSDKNTITELMETNPQVIIALLMNLKKYEELEKLLNKNNIINPYDKTNILNTVGYLKFKDENLPKAKSYIVENLKMIKNRIKEKPNDSLRYADYFSMRMFLVGKKGALKEIDSMKAVNKNYSDIFYDAILKDAIESYPEEYLPK